MANTFSNGYALLVGVGSSAYPYWSLPVSVKDMQALRLALTDSALCAYPDDPDHIRLLRDQDASRQAILDGLEWLRQRAQADQDATVMVYYSGHGWLDKPSGHYYLIPHDVEPFDLPGSALPAEQFSAALHQVQARRLLVILDCCHAAGMASAKDAPAFKLPPNFKQSEPPKAVLEALKQGQGRVVFMSSRGEQKSWIRPDNKLSIFTDHLLEALQGAANKPGDTDVRISNLMNHLGRAVPTSVRRAYQVDQTPFFDAATEDFPVALLRGSKGLPAGGWEDVREESEQERVRIVQASDHSVAIGGDVTGSTIITGSGREQV